MKRHDFLNRLRTLHNIDYCELPGMSAQQVTKFLENPVRFFMCCDDPTAEIIWTAIQSHQRQP